MEHTNDLGSLICLTLSVQTSFLAFWPWLADLCHDSWQSADAEQSQEALETRSRSMDQAVTRQMLRVKASPARVSADNLPVFRGSSRLKVSKVLAGCSCIHLLDCDTALCMSFQTCCQALVQFLLAVLHLRLPRHPLQLYPHVHLLNKELTRKMFCGSICIGEHDKEHLSSGISHCCSHCLVRFCSYRTEDLVMCFSLCHAYRRRSGEL